MDVTDSGHEKTVTREGTRIMSSLPFQLVRGFLFFYAT